MGVSRFGRRGILIVRFVLGLFFLFGRVFVLRLFLPARRLNCGDFVIIQIPVLIFVEALESSIRGCGVVLANGGFLLGINHTIVVGVVFGKKLCLWPVLLAVFRL